jgi:hypothetical protein
MRRSFGGKGGGRIIVCLMAHMDGAWTDEPEEQRNGDAGFSTSGADTASFEAPRFVEEVDLARSTCKRATFCKFDATSQFCPGCSNP